MPTLPEPWLTVCVDDVQSVKEARKAHGTGLVLVGSPSGLDGLRLPPVAQALSTQYGNGVAVTAVRDFTVTELQQYLERNGHDWGTLPPDVRGILRRPLLASLYCDIAAGEDWRPRNEYSLFSRLTGNASGTTGTKQTILATAKDATAATGSDIL